MSGLIRIALFAVAAIVAIFIVIAVLKIVVALALLAAAVVAGVFIYNFGRAFYRRMTAAPQPPVMLN